MSFFLGFFPIFVFLNFNFQILILFHFQHKFQQQGSLQSTELDPRIVIHYGIPSSSSVLAFDPIQRLLAIGTLSVLHSLSLYWFCYYWLLMISMHVMLATIVFFTHFCVLKLLFFNFVYHSFLVVEVWAASIAWNNC